MALEKWVFECFASPIYKNGKKTLIGIGDSEKLKRAAVIRGFATKAGTLRKKLSPLDVLVMVMREATSAEDFNHEWWAAEASKPEWVRRLDTMFCGGWLYFPTKESEATARNIGLRIGYQLGLKERRLGRSLREQNYRQRLEEAELEKAKRGLEKEDQAKVRMVFPGYENFRQLAAEGYAALSNVRREVMAVSGALREQEFDEFIRGMAEGAVTAQEMEIGDEMSEFNEREEVAEILSEGWWTIHQMKTRREITDYVISRLPERRRAFLEKSRTEPPDRREQYKRFVERLRQTFFEKIGLGPSGRGRPKK
jgi:hypothetical protein